MQTRTGAFANWSKHNFKLSWASLPVMRCLYCHFCLQSTGQSGTKLLPLLLYLYCYRFIFAVHWPATTSSGGATYTFLPQWVTFTAKALPSIKLPSHQGHSLHRHQLDPSSHRGSWGITDHTPSIYFRRTRTEIFQQIVRQNWSRRMQCTTRTDARQWRCEGKTRYPR